MKSNAGKKSGKKDDNRKSGKGKQESDDEGGLDIEGDDSAGESD